MALQPQTTPTPIPSSLDVTPDAPQPALAPVPAPSPSPSLQRCWLIPVDPITGDLCHPTVDVELEAARVHRGRRSGGVVAEPRVPMVVGGGLGVTRMFCTFCGTVQPAHRACQNPGCTHTGKPTRYYCAPCGVWRHDKTLRFHCHLCGCCRPGTPLLYMHTNILSRCRHIFRT